MRRFWLFGGNDYYATGGFHDFIGSFNTLDDAVKEGETRSVEWWHVFDSESQEIAGQSEYQAYGSGEFPPLA